MVNQETKGDRLGAKNVANEFLVRYYGILQKCPDSLHKFYKDGSALRWTGVESTTTMQGIHEVIMASDYKGCEVKVLTVDAQDSLTEGLVLTVIGCLLGTDNIKRIVSHTFILAKQEKGFYVLNDNLRVIDTQEILKVSFACDNVDESASIATDASSPQEPGPIDLPADTKSVNEVTSMGATDSVKKTSEVNVPAAEVLKQPITLTHNVTPLSASNENPEGQKMSYASVVAKERKAAPAAENHGHKIVRVAPSSNQQPVASPRANIAKGTKERSSYNRSSTENNSNTQKGSNNIRSEDSIARSVYIENLPKDITKDELAEAVKVFGLARPSDIQIKTFRQDGFCYGFVEFESEASAKSAVEARKLTVKGFDVRILFKKSGSRGTGGSYHSRNFKGQEGGENRSNGSYHDDNGGRVYGRQNREFSERSNWPDYNGRRGYDRQNREFGERNNGSRDGRAYGEAHPRNNWRNGEQSSWNGGNRVNGQVENGGVNNSSEKSAAKA